MAVDDSDGAVAETLRGHLFFKHVQGMVTIRAQEGVETEAGEEGGDCCQGCYRSRPSSEKKALEV